MRIAIAVLLALTVAGGAEGANPATELFVAAAARGPGSGTSVWSTDLFLYNPNDTAATVTVAWLVRDRPNPAPAAVTLTVGAGQALHLDDVLLADFGFEAAAGAFRITADVPVVATAAILNEAGGVEFGQGFEGIPREAAVAAGTSSAATGLRSGADFRANVFLVDATGTGSVATAVLTDPSGAPLGSRTYQLGAYQPVLEAVSGFAPSFAAGTLEIQVVAGAVIGGASRVNQASGDPLTLAMWWPLAPPEAGGGGGDSGLGGEGTYYGSIQSASYQGGFTLELVGTAAAADDGGAEGRGVRNLSFTFPSELPGCTFFFNAGASFATPLPLSALTGSTYELEQGYGVGTMRWFVRLDDMVPGLYMEGPVTGYGTGWQPPYEACNGLHPAAYVRFGKRPPADPATAPAR